MSELDPVLVERPPERTVPFWNYEDLFVFIALAIPSLALGWVVVSILALFLPFGPRDGALYLFTMQFAGYAIWFLALFCLLRVRYRAPFWPSIGWVRPRRGLLLSIALGPLLAVGVAVAAALLDTPKVVSPIEKLIVDWRSLVIVGVAAATVGPFCEEIAFRGFMLPLLVRSLGPIPGVFITALPFALLHGPQYGWQWQNLLLLTGAACCFGWARVWTDSIIPPIVMHAAYNLTFLTGYAIHRDLSFQW